MDSAPTAAPPSGSGGLINERDFDAELERQVTRARHDGGALSLVVLELELARSRDAGLTDRDSFREAIELVRARTRDVAVILPEIDLHGAAELAETIRAQIEQARFVFDDHPIALTISVGVAELEPHIATADDLVGAAAARLARAKDSGRNRVVSDRDDEPAPESTRSPPHES